MIYLFKYRTKVTLFALSFLIWASLFHQQTNAQSPLDVAGTANKTAVASGDWTSTATWGGSLPATDARVRIPAGITVTVDSEISTEFKSIRIDGTLRFAHNVNTQLRSEYFVGGMSSKLEIGTASNPIASNVTAQLVFADRGGTSTSQDPERFAPGAIFMGQVEMRGEAKTSWTTLAVQPSAGATSLTLGTTPQNWKAGDKLVLAATILDNPESDDLVEISSISGNTVQLTTPTVFDHKAPAQVSNLDVHVANLTRNIKIWSENPSVSAKRRGHMMFMHTLNVDLRYVEFYNTGRTDKFIELDDYEWEDLNPDPNYEPIRGEYTNPRGRYSVHFHRGGVDPALTPAHVEGVSVNNDPGWAYVNHSARVDFVKNVSYDIVGAAYNTESGDETGSFIENIALRSVNASYPYNFPLGDLSIADNRERFADFGWQGDGFWLHGMGVNVEGNVVAGVTGHGIVYWPEGLLENGLGRRIGDIDLHIPDPAQRALLNGVPSNFVLETWYIPMGPCKNNVIYTVPKGLAGSYMQTAFLDEDEERYNIVTDAYQNSLNMILDNNTIWNITHKGIQFQFASDMTIKNNHVIGYGSPPNTAGIDLGHFHNEEDWTIQNNTIEGFNNNNVGLIPPHNATVLVDGDVFNNASTDIKIYETNFFEGALDIDPPVPSNHVNRNMTISNVTFHNSNSNIVMDPEFTLNARPQDGFTHVTLGQPKFLYYFMLGDQITLNYGPFQNATLYFNQQDTNYVPITNNNYELEVEPGDPSTEWVIPSTYRNKTNAQLRALTSPSTSFGGELMPSTAVSHPSIIGGKVSAISGNPCNDAPEAPASVIAINNACNSINISWSGVDCEDNYRIERRVGSGNWVMLNNIVADTTYTDNNPANGLNQYRVRAQNTDGNSTYTTSNSIDCSSTSPPQYTLTVSTAGNGNGTVSLNPTGGTYDEGTVVTLTATAGTDSQFDNWSGSVTGTNNPVTITMNSNQSVMAHFSETSTGGCDGVPPGAPVSVTTLNYSCDSIKISWPIVDCADDYLIQRKVGSGSWLVLKDSLIGTSFTDNSPAANVNQYRVRAQNIDGNSAFTTSGSTDCTPAPPQYTLTVNTAGNGSGTVSLNPSGGVYDEGTVVTLTATANSDSQFDNWSGGLSGTNNPVTITMNTNQSITAHFSELPAGGCTWEVIDDNDFESGWGIWHDGGSDCRRSIYDDDYATSGSYCVRLRDNTSTSVMTTDDLDLSSYDEVKVEFSYYCRSMDNSNEDFWLQVSTDGGDSFTTVEEWNRDDEFVNNEFYSDEVTISGMTFTDITVLRFRCDASGNSDWVYIDDVIISGCGNGSGGGGGNSSTIDVINFSFEEPGTGELEMDFDYIPGWSNSGSGDSGVEKGWGDPTDGEWICFIEAGSNYVYQTLDHPIEAGKTYTLELDAKDLDDNGANAQVQLKHGSTNIQNVQQQLNEDWQTITISFNSDNYPNAIGEDLRIFFRNNGEDDSWAGFDNFRLTTSSNSMPVFTNDNAFSAETTKRPDTGLKVFPNPIGKNQTLTLQVTGFGRETLISIFDANGRMVIQKTANETTSIFTGDLPDGIYFVKVVSDNRMETGRFVIQD